VARAPDRTPAALTFVIAVSGSRGQQTRLGLVKAALARRLDELRPDHRVALVFYGSRGRVVLEPTADKEALRAAIDRLQPEGATNAEEGLALGYRLASEALRPGAINRVVLASDGVANVGATGPDSILATVRSQAARGIELTTLGFGMGNYNDVLMERLADEGDGRYAYIDTLDEARRVLVEELTGTLQTVAEEARAQVEINPEVVERYRLLGYENRDVADERFRDDTVDAGEIGAGHTVTALYEIKLRKAATGRAGTRAYRHAPVAILRLRWRPAGTDAFVETERPLTVGELARRWESATPALRLAGLAAELAELLRGSYWAREGSLDAVFRGLQQLQPELAGDARAAELAAMAGKAARLEAERAAAEAEADPGG
jgi:Ca-activated chloride channel family protein